MKYTIINTEGKTFKCHKVFQDGNDIVFYYMENSSKGEYEMIRRIPAEKLTNIIYED